MKIYILCQYCATKKEIAFKLIQAQTNKQILKKILKGEDYRSTKSNLRISKSDIGIPTFVVFQTEIKHKPKPNTVIGVVFKWSAWKRGNTYDPIITVHSAYELMNDALELVQNKVPNAKLSSGTYNGISEEYIIYEGKSPILWCIGPAIYAPVEKSPITEPITKSVTKPVAKSVVESNPTLYEEKEEKEYKSPARPKYELVKTVPQISNLTLYEEKKQKLPQSIKQKTPVIPVQKLQKSDRKPQSIKQKTPALPVQKLQKTPAQLEHKSVPKVVPKVPKVVPKVPKVVPKVPKVVPKVPKVVPKVPKAGSNYVKAPFALGQYFTHDNGARPYRVVLNKNNVEIYENNFIKIGHFVAKGVFIGGKDVKGEEGNSMLVSLGNSRYAFIGHNIAEFTTPDNDEIVVFYSPVGNSDVPYPVAVGRKYVYFLMKGYYAPVSSFGGKNWVGEAYSLFFEKRLEGVKKLKLKYVMKRFEKKEKTQGEKGLEKLLKNNNVLGIEFITEDGWEEDPTGAYLLKVVVAVKNRLWDYYYVRSGGEDEWMIFEQVVSDAKPRLEVDRAYFDKNGDLSVVFLIGKGKGKKELEQVYTQEGRKWRNIARVEG